MVVFSPALDEHGPTQSRRRLETATFLALGIAPYYLNGFYNAQLASRPSPLAFWLIDVATWVVLPAVVLIASHRRGLFTSRDVGLTTEVGGRERPWAFFLLFFAIPLGLWHMDAFVVRWADASLPSFRYTSFEYGAMVPPRGPDTGWLRLLVLFHFCVTAGVVEELYYRGMMSQLFGGGCLGTSGYVLTSSLAFAGAHWEGGLPRLAESFVFGVAAALIFRLTRNMWPLMAAHIFIDWYWFSQ